MDARPRLLALSRRRAHSFGNCISQISNAHHSEIRRAEFARRLRPEERISELWSTLARRRAASARHHQQHDYGGIPTVEARRPKSRALGAEVFLASEGSCADQEARRVVR